MNASKITTILVCQTLYEEILRILQKPLDERKADWPSFYARLRATPPPLPGEPSAIIVIVQANDESIR